MAQKGSNKRKQAPAYSADTMAIRYMAGLALIALGAVIFMAVELRLDGNIFEGLRRICFGLSGIMAYALPVLPLWAGGLVIWSTQRRAPVKPWLYALLAFFGLCAFLMITGAMQYLKDTYGNEDQFDSNVEEFGLPYLLSEQLRPKAVEIIKKYVTVE